MNTLWFKSNVMYLDEENCHMSAFEIWLRAQTKPERRAFRVLHMYTPDKAICISKVECLTDFAFIHLTNSLPIIGAGLFVEYSNSDNLLAILPKAGTDSLSKSFPNAKLSGSDNVKTLIEKIVRTTQETTGFKL